MCSQLCAQTRLVDSWQDKDRCLGLDAPACVRELRVVRSSKTDSEKNSKDGVDCGGKAHGGAVRGDDPCAKSGIAPSRARPQTLPRQNETAVSSAPPHAAHAF